MPKILVVEDDETTLLSITNILEGENYRVEGTDNGLVALELFSIAAYDLAIIDWDIPGISGLELCKSLRKRHSECRILMLTGKDAEEEKEAGLDGGADDYLTKPFLIREFLARIRALLRRGQNTIDEVISIASITIDTRQRTVSKGGEPVDLKTREFALLEFLARNRGTVYSLDALIKYVWSSDENVTYDAVRQCVKRVRQKLDDSEQSIISTVVGIGYKVV